MGALKHYVLTLICRCVPDQTMGQDAIEYAIHKGIVPISYNLEDDIKRVMANYDRIIEVYQQNCRRQELLGIGGCR